MSVQEVETVLIKEMKSKLNIQGRLNAALFCLFKIKRAYPDVYRKCLSDEDIASFSERRHNVR